MGIGDGGEIVGRGELGMGSHAFGGDGSCLQYPALMRQQGDSVDRPAHPIQRVAGSSMVEIPELRQGPCLQILRRCCVVIGGVSRYLAAESIRLPPRCTSQKMIKDSWRGIRLASLMSEHD